MNRTRSLNPATGEVLQEIPFATPEQVRMAFERAAAAQKLWGERPATERAKHLLSLRETLVNRADDFIQVLSEENGKPRFEVLSSEILAALELLTFYAKKTPQILADQPIPLRLMKHRKSYLQRWPLGVVAVIAPWNYPFFLPFGEIVMALAAGNAVVFKPSEAATRVGLKIQELLDEAGIPEGLVQTLPGDGTVGAEIIRNRPAKIFFTGSVRTGKKIQAAAAENLIPVSLELGGKDAMIVLSDADLDFATSAALWGGFTNSGQACASVERLLVHESIASEFEKRLVEKVAALRAGPSTSDTGNDLGPVTYDLQKKVYEEQLSEAKSRGLEFLAGGNFSSDQRYLSPTLVKGSGIEESRIYREETFGPVIALTTFRSLDEAVRKANDSPYGLLASVFTRNHALGEQVARQLHVGTVTVNEVLYTAGLPETPWGGIKETGSGRKHSAEGLLDFVHTRHVHLPRSSLFVFKSFWWFPYTPYQYASFRVFLESYRNSWVSRIRSIPVLLWNLVQFIKNEKRL